MKARRILVIVTKLDQGGGVLVPLQVADGLRDRGHSVETWFLYKHRSAYEDHDGVRIILSRQVRSLLDYFQIFVRLIVAMRSFRPDAVHGVLPLGNVLGLSCAALIGCPSRVASQHNPAKTHNRVMQWLDKLFGRVGIYTGNIAVSYTVQKSYQQYPSPYFRRLRVIQNAIPERPACRSKSEARSHFGLPSEALILGNIGRLTYQKNQEFLFPVMEQLEGIHLVIAGEGECFEQYAREITERGLSDRVHLLGSIPEGDVPDFLAAIDVFVLPSRYEGLPIALLEALQAGLPIVASDIPPACEVISPEDQAPAGLLLSTDSAEAWIEALGKVLNDPSQLKCLSEAAQKRSRDFSINMMIDSYEACLLGCYQS